MKKFGFLAMATVLALASACSSNDDIAGTNDNGTNATGSLTAFSGESITEGVRTSMTHEIGGKGVFAWESGDYIWIENNGSFVKGASNNITGSTASAKFYANGTFTNSTYNVFYTGKNSTSGNQVTIASVQKQETPNSAKHFGESGDCGVATATRTKGGEYGFKLTHKAAYLCILPRTEDANLSGSKITQIEISSDNNIAGTYNFSTSGLASTPTTGAKTIVMQLGQNGDGFTLDNARTDINKNGTFVVIAPGTHNLTVRYFLTKSSSTGVSNFTVTKTLSNLNCVENTVKDIYANLSLQDYSADHYFWDAKQSFWYGKEADKNIGENGTITTNTPGLYPTAGSDRWYNTTSGKATAQYSAKNCPNKNEAIWYLLHGDIHWDANQAWEFGGRIFKGGVWIKKKAYISGFSSTQSENPYYLEGAPADHNYDTTRGEISITKSGRPSNISEYFFLPASGWITKGSGNGQLYYIGERGYYWLNVAEDDSNAYVFYFDKNKAHIVYEAREVGRNIWTAQ